MTALSLYERYVASMEILHNKGKYTGDDFMDLFVAVGDTIYNDIVPANHPSLVSAYQYFTTYDSIVRYADFEYGAFQMKTPQKEGNKWYVDCSFMREVRYVTRDTVFNIYPRWKFNYQMRIEMDAQMATERRSGGSVEYSADSLFANPRIVSIKVKEPLIEPAVLVNHDRIPLRYKDDSVQNYDEECDCWMMDASKVNIGEIKYDGDNLFLQLNHVRDAQHPHFYTFGIDRMNIGGLTLSYAPNGLGNRSDGRFEDIAEQSHSAKASLFYGWQLSNTPTASWFLNVGLDIASNTYTYSGTYRRDYVATDIDGDEYLRGVRATLHNETRGETEFILPVSVSYAKNLLQRNGRQLFLNLKAGAFVGVRHLSTAEVDLSARYTGYYSQYYNAEFDHYYDYGNFDMNQQNIADYRMGEANPVDYGVDAGIGLWYAWNRKYLIGVDVAFRQSFSPVLKYADYKYLTQHFDHYESMLQTSKQGASNFYFGLSLIKLLSR